MIIVSTTAIYLLLIFVSLVFVLLGAPHNRIPYFRFGNITELYCKRNNV